MFNNVYSNKKVLVTGHTGFKGTWLTTWLLKLGAKVVGVSDCIPTVPSMFTELNLQDKIEHNIIDVRDLNTLKRMILNTKPDFVFHLAAQPIVSESYLNPIDTISTNVMGTANILESIRALENQCVAIIITSDKCYENVEWEWGYKETDHLGGVDIYSGSKGAAEVIFHSYFKSFFSGAKCNVRVGTGRAGNVIGGGDWAKDRIVVDCMKNWADGKTVEIRSPNATRPWQHVLEPLSGYLTLGAELTVDEKLTGESFNFGPRSEKTKTVIELLNSMSESCDFETIKVPYEITDNIPFHEAGLLKLNCDKALFHLNWEPTLYYSECVDLVSIWYNKFYNSKQKNMYDLTIQQIEKYESYAKKRELNWVGN